MIRSEWELLFGQLLKENKIPYVAEYKFHPKRRWRFDFVVQPVERMIAIEVDGGVYSHGRHTRGKGFENDCEKFNTATAMGWRIFRFTPNQINSMQAIEWVKELLDRERISEID